MLRQSVRSSTSLRITPNCVLLSATKRHCATSSAAAAAAATVPKPEQKRETPEQLAQRLRKDTDREVYEPGVVAKALRSVVVGVSNTFGLQRRFAKRMETGLKEVERLEKEQKWLRRHGSPLRVLGLPETADLEDIKVRYRNLLFEVHPDTAPRADKEALVAAGMSEEKARERQMEEFDLLKSAYHIATSPNSLWHQDGNAPLLLRELQGPTGIISRIVTPQNMFPVVAYLYGLGVAVFFCSIVAYYFFLALLQAVDPDFYNFMLGQEAEERRKREAGEEVDTDPKRLAPKKMMRISAPGKFVNSARVPDEEEFDDLPVAKS